MRREQTSAGHRRGIAMLAAGLTAAMLATSAAFALGGLPARLERTAPSPVVPVAVFGTDDRTSVPARLEAVAEKTGLLFNNQSRTVCSAFCVADNVIATAAHCLRGPNGGAPRYADFTFARHYDRTRDYSRIEGAETGAGAQHIASGDFKLSTRPPIDAARDWALIRLQRKGCPSGGLVLQPMPTAGLIKEAQAGRIFQISYHRDYAQWRPAYSKPCTVAREFGDASWGAIAPDFENAEAIVLHTCDTGGASSGSPLLMETAQGVAVVGINVGTYVQSKITTRNGQVTVRQKQQTVANTAVNAQAFAGILEPLRRGAILSAGPPMRELQIRLKSLGFYSGRVDGAFGSGVRSAIVAYELARKLPATGLATQDMLAKLTQEVPLAGEVTPSSGARGQDVPPKSPGR